MLKKDIILSLLNNIGVNSVFRFVNRSKDLCLMYHGVVPDDYPIESWLLVKETQFKKQLQYLKRHWEVVHIDTYIEGKFKTLKPKAMITFDDGYCNNYHIAYPVLKELQLPATIYIVTDFIDSKKLFWFDKVIYAVQNSHIASLYLTDQLEHLGEYTFSGNGKQRWNDIENLLKEIKALGVEGSNKAAQCIFDDVNPNSNNIDLLTPLTKGQIHEMLQSGLVEIGSHTANHEILTDLSIEEAEQTVGKSVNDICNLIGRSPVHFSYPNGNYTETIVNLMDRFNFSSAMSTRYNFINPKNFIRYEIPRITVGLFDSIYSFKSRLSGLDFFVRSFT